MKRFAAILLIFVLTAGMAMTGAATLSYAEPASVAGIDRTVSTGQFSSGFIDENNVFYMAGYAKNIPWHHEGNMTTEEGSAIWSYPVKVMDNARSISFAHETFGVIRTDGSLWMWGDNTNGLVGNGGAYDGIVTVSAGEGNEPWKYYYQYEPVKVLDNVAAFSLSETYCAAIRTDGSLWMWGVKGRIPNHKYGDLTFQGKQEVPLKVLDGVRCVSCASSGIAIVKTDGSLWTWGVTGSAPNGYDYYFTRKMDHVKAVSCGSSYMAILKDDDSLWMAGVNGYGQLGNGTMDGSGQAVYHEPAKVLDHVVQFTTGSANAAAVTADGSLYVWGNRTMCGLGDGSMVAGKMHPIPEACLTTPTKILDNVVAVDLPRNQHRGFAVKKDGTLWGWGVNRNGELGNGSAGDTSGSVSFASGSEVQTASFPVQSSPVKIMPGIRTTSLSGQSLTPAAPAIDPDPSAWAKSIVEKAIGQKLVPEALQGNYTKPITRAEFCALAATLYESRMGEVTDRKTFDDTKDANVEKMAAIGVVAGVGNNKFAPDRDITREQAATMLAALAGALGKPIEESEPSFADNGDISGWAVPYVGKMQTSGIMNGTGNGNFSPLGSYTREQSIATMLSVLAYVDE
ncbi:MAG: S-layer homology domain-containing protein [Firmicutes bacterium]|nr:S-layer homology domain-containing protein [Bacillota bacterium]